MKLYFMKQSAIDYMKANMRTLYSHMIRSKCLLTCRTFNWHQSENQQARLTSRTANGCTQTCERSVNLKHLMNDFGQAFVMLRFIVICE